MAYNTKVPKFFLSAKKKLKFSKFGKPYFLREEVYFVGAVFIGRYFPQGGGCGYFPLGGGISERGIFSGGTF